MSLSPRASKLGDLGKPLMTLVPRELWKAEKEALAERAVRGSRAAGVQTRLEESPPDWLLVPLPIPSQERRKSVLRRSLVQLTQPGIFKRSLIKMKRSREF